MAAGPPSKPAPDPALSRPHVDADALNGERLHLRLDGCLLFPTQAECHTGHGQGLDATSWRGSARLALMLLLQLLTQFPPLLRRQLPDLARRRLCGLALG